jgi:hypothetical protein
VLMGYCLADAVYMTIFERDTLMIIHHIAVVIGVLPLYLMPHGWMLGIVSTFFAEITNPLQNTWQYMRDYGSKSVYQVRSLSLSLSVSCPGIHVTYFRRWVNSCVNLRAARSLQECFPSPAHTPSGPKTFGAEVFHGVARVARCTRVGFQAVLLQRPAVARRGETSPAKNPRASRGGGST